MSPIIIKAVNRLLLQAIEEEVKALHWEFPRDGSLSVSWLRHGQLEAVAGFAKPLSTGIKNYLNRLIKQPATNITVATPAGQISLRASRLPIKGGEKIVLNLKPTGGDLIPLNCLGLNNEHLALLKPAITASGLVIITGPSGAGKTTTAYAILSALNANRANVYAVEDMAGQDLPGINQLSRPPGLSWPMLFRTLEKQDADIIYLDINDSIPPAHDLTILATRRLVIVSLDASSISDCLTKLNLGSGVNKINLIINQALARRSCPHCAFSYQLDRPAWDELVKDFGTLDEDLIGLDLYHNSGCEICNHSGYVGHLGLYEMLAPDMELKQLITNVGLTNAVQSKIQADITLSLPEDGFIKALQGFITIEELKRVI